MKKSTWGFLWSSPIILAILLLIWAACILIVTWFVNTSGEKDPIWIIMFCTLPIGTMYLSWLIIKLMYHSEVIDL